jgi:small subunit ribosomal protein S4
MGDPKKLRKKYETPRHPWQATRIIAERSLINEYGLKNKKEIWKAQSLLRKFTKQAKSLSTVKAEHEERTKQQLLSRLIKLGLLNAGQSREDVLGLNVKDILERRLQTLLFKKGLARTIKQSRQLIVHGHIMINEQKITVPGYLVQLDEENKIGFLQNSSLNDQDNPERILINEKNKLSEQEQEIKDSKDKKEETKKAKKEHKKNEARQT